VIDPSIKWKANRRLITPVDIIHSRLSKKHSVGKVLAVDFDGVIHDHKRPIDGKRMGKPLPGAEQSVNDLYNQGYTIIIHSQRANSESGKQSIVDWLDHYGISYSAVTALKPPADFYIDDKAVTHKDWPTTLMHIGYVPEVK
jgi:hypothetical protein